MAVCLLIPVCGGKPNESLQIKLDQVGDSAGICVQRNRGCHEVAPFCYDYSASDGTSFCGVVYWQYRAFDESRAFQFQLVFGHVDPNFI